MNKKIVVSTLVLTLSMSLPLLAQQQSLADRVDRLERITDNPVLIQMSRKLGQQQSEIQELQNKIDHLERKLSQLSTKEDKRYKESDDRLSRLESLSRSGSLIAKETLLNKPEIKAEKAKEIEVLPATETEKLAYQAAFSLIKEKDFKGALTSFKNFRKTYPSSSLASNASYWAGEASLSLGNSQQALKHFLDVVNSYPSSNKAADALLRAGDTYKRLEDKEQAKATFKKVIKSYPNSRAAKKSASRLKGMP